MKELKVDKDNAKIDKVLNAFEDEKDKLLGFSGDLETRITI